MRDYALVQRSPEKPNIYLACEKFESIVETFFPIAEKLKKERMSMDRIIVFCKKRMLCSQIYSFFRYILRDEFTEPPGQSEAKVEYRLVDMFTSVTHPVVKEQIIKSFKTPTAPLRIVISTIAFGMGVDCNEVYQIIHVGPPEDVESYIQHIGRCGRDGKPACALMLYGKKLMENTTDDLIKYCNISNVCRRNYLFSDFECFVKSSVSGCKCCDVCKLSCVCISCKN